MKAIQKVRYQLEAIVDHVELNVSAALFLVVLIGFSATVVMRYVWRISIAHIDEIIVIAFSWMIMLISPYNTKSDQHVSFTVLHDALSPKPRAVLSVIGKGIVLVCLVLLVLPSWSTIQFYAIRRMPMLKLRFNWVYLPYMVFLLLTLYYSVISLLSELRNLRTLFAQHEQREER